MAFAALLAASAWGADNASDGSGAQPESKPEPCASAVLRNGFSVPYLRREVHGGTTRLWLCDRAGAAYVEIPGEEIERFEQAESATAVAAPTPPSGAEKAPPALLPVKDPMGELVAEAARRHQIDPDFLASVIKIESHFNPAAVSPKGARGLMQLMPETAARLGVENAFDPSANVEGGTKYLRQLLEQYHWDAVKALAAYNAGAERVKQYGGIPPYRETRAYITRIIEDFNRKKLGQQAQATAAPVGGQAPDLIDPTPVK